MAKEISKSLIIGVGGTGQNIIIALKKRLFQRFGEIPEFIKMISIDADIIDEKDENFTYEFQGKLIKQDIFIEESEQSYFSRVNMREQLEDKVYSSFVPPNIKKIASGMSSGKGAEGKRIVGKMLLASHYDKIEKFINDKIGEIITKESDNGYEVSNGSVKVFIVGSFAGGAGSSMFVDVSNMVINSTYNTNNNSINLVGFFAMPEFYKQYPNQDNALANGYGSFIELDYIQEPDVPYSKRIPTFNNEEKRLEGQRFDSVYVVQNLLSNNTKIGRDTMEDAVAAAISNLVSVIGKEGDTIGVNNQQFDSNLMEGKRRGYSSFGICEIVLKRNELKQFIISKLIQNALNEYSVNNFTKEEFDERCDDFIKSHKLDEGVGAEAKSVNELIDSIYELDDSELDVFFNENITVSDAVVEDLKESYKTFKQDLKSKTDSLVLLYDDKILNDFEDEKGNIKKGIKTELQDKLNELLYANGGISRTKLFAQSFVTQLNQMRLELNKEIVEHEEAITEIETNQLSGIYDDIREEQDKFFTKKSKIRDLIKNYSYLISNPSEMNSFRNHYLDIIRKTKAIDVYKKLISIVKEYYHKDGNESYGRVSIFEDSINHAKNTLALDLRQFVAANNKPFDRINVNVNFFMIKVLENKKIYNEIVKNNPLDVADFLSRKGSTNSLLDDLRNILEEEIKSGNTILTQLVNDQFTVDDLINKYKNVKIKIGDHKSGFRDITLEKYLLKEINNNIPIMWNYSRMNVKDESGTIKEPELVAFIGNYDGKDGFISYDIISKFKGLPSKIAPLSYSKVATNNPDVISIYIQEHAVPAYKLANIDLYKRDFELRSKSTTSYFYTDVRFEKYAPDIFPQKNDEKSLKLWVVGFVTGLIFNKSRGYYIKIGGKNQKCFDETNPKGKNDRISTFEYFYNNQTFVKNINERYDRMLDIDKGKIRKQLLDYFHNKMFERNNLGKFKNSLSEKEKELLFKEEKMIISIGFDDLGMHSKDFINPELKGEALEDHKQHLEGLGAEEVW